MALPEGRKGEQGAVKRVGLYAVRSTDEERFFPVYQNEDGELFVAIMEPIDEITGGVLAIDTFHHEIHEGETYIVSEYDGAVADAAAIIFHLTPGPTYSHLTFTGSMGGDATIELLENPTITGGAAHNEYNLKRTAADTPDTVVLLNPTINTDGTIIFEDLIPGGTGGNAVGGMLGLRPHTEWILHPDRTYAVRLTNVSGQERKGALVCEWYEESDN